MSLAAYQAAVLADSPHTYWDCQDASGLLQDESGNGRHATGSQNTGDVTYGAPGPCGDDDSIRFSGASGDPWSNFTRTPPTAVNNISLEWFYLHDPDVVVGGPGLWINGNFTNTGWYWNAGSNQMRLSLAGVAHLSFFTNDLVVDEWHHLVAVRDAGTWKYYYNGALDNGNVSTSAPNAPDSAWLLGNFFGQRSYGVAHVAYYESVLSAERILAHYEAALESEPVVIGRYYKRIIGPQHLPASAATLYTVPNNARVELRALELNNPSGSTRKVTLSIGTDAASTRFVELLDIPAGESVHASRIINHALEAGEIIQGYADSAGVIVAVGNAWVEQN